MSPRTLSIYGGESALPTRQWMWQTGSHFGKGKYKEYDARTSMFVEKAFAAKKPCEPLMY